jgi:hypothetical protein
VHPEQAQRTVERGDVGDPVDGHADPRISVLDRAQQVQDPDALHHPPPRAAQPRPLVGVAPAVGASQPQADRQPGRHRDRPRPQHGGLDVGALDQQQDGAAAGQRREHGVLERAQAEDPDRRLAVVVTQPDQRPAVDREAAADRVGAEAGDDDRRDGPQRQAVGAADRLDRAEGRDVPGDRHDLPTDQQRDPARVDVAAVADDRRPAGRSGDEDEHAGADGDRDAGQP